MSGLPFTAMVADRRLGHAAKVVGVALWSLAVELADGRWICAASRAQIAAAAGASVGAVARALEPSKGGELVLLGWVRDADGLDAWELRPSASDHAASVSDAVGQRPCSVGERRNGVGEQTPAVGERRRRSATLPPSVGDATSSASDAPPSGEGGGRGG